MSIITKMRKQSCVYWALTGFDNYGQPTWDSPVEIDCRWEDVHEEFIDANEQRQISKAIIYVDRDICVGSILMLGALDSGVDEISPKQNDNAYEIQRFEKLPTLKATEFLRTAIL